MSAEERLQRLERELTRAKRRDHWLLVGLVLAAMMGFLGWTGMGAAVTAHAQPAAQAQKVISAQGFVLEDENGKNRAVLGMTAEGPVLRLLDENGKVRAELGQKAIHGQAFILGDEFAKNHSRAILVMSPEGPMLILSDENGNIRTSLSVFGTGSRLDLMDAKSEARATLSLGETGPRLILVDASGTERVTLGVSEDGPVLDLLDASGTARATLGAGRTRTPDGTRIRHPESSLLLFGPDGKVTWQAPR